MECKKCEEIYCGLCIAKSSTDKIENCKGCKKKFESRKINRGLMNVATKVLKFSHLCFSNATSTSYTYESLVTHLKNECKSDSVAIVCPQNCKNLSLRNKSNLFHHISVECS